MPEAGAPRPRAGFLPGMPATDPSNTSASSGGARNSFLSMRLHFEHAAYVTCTLYKKGYHIPQIIF
jgi:hypothetical protein